MGDAYQTGSGHRKDRCLPEAACLALGFEKSEDVTLPDGALDVADDRPVWVVEKVDANLSNSTARAGTTDNLGHLTEFDRLIHG
jgi:hypothetical protein